MDNTRNIEQFHLCNYLNPMKDNAYSMLNRCINDIDYNCPDNCNINLLSLENDSIDAFDNDFNDNRNIRQLNNINMNNLKNNNDIVNNLEGFVVNLNTGMEPTPTENDFVINNDVEQEFKFFRNNQGYLYDVNDSNYVKIINNGILDIETDKPEPYGDICYPYNYAGINNNGNILCDTDYGVRTELFNIKQQISPNFIPPSLR